MAHHAVLRGLLYRIPNPCHFCSEERRCRLFRALPRRRRQLQPFPSCHELGSKHLLSYLEERGGHGIHGVNFELRVNVGVKHCLDVDRTH